MMERERETLGLEDRVGGKNVMEEVIFHEGRKHGKEGEK